MDIRKKHFRGKNQAAKQGMAPFYKKSKMYKTSYSII